MIIFNILTGSRNKNRNAREEARICGAYVFFTKNFHSHISSINTRTCISSYSLTNARIHTLTPSMMHTYVTLSNRRSPEIGSWIICQNSINTLCHRPCLWMGHPCLRIKLRLHWWHSMRVNFPYPKTFSFLTFFPTRTWWHFERFTHLTQKNINTGPIMKPEWIGDPYFLPSSFPSYKVQSPLRKWWSVWWVPIYLQTGLELCGPHILSTERNTIRPTRWSGPHRHLRPWLILSGLQRTYFVFTPLSFDCSVRASLRCLITPKSINTRKQVRVWKLQCVGNNADIRGKIVGSSRETSRFTLLELNLRWHWFQRSSEWERKRIIVLERWSRIEKRTSGWYISEQSRTLNFFPISDLEQH